MLHPPCCFHRLAKGNTWDRISKPKGVVWQNVSSCFFLLVFPTVVEGLFGQHFFFSEINFLLLINCMGVCIVFFP